MRWAVGTSVGALVALAWALARGGVVMPVVMSVLAAVAAWSWVGVVHANLGGRRELRLGYERFLLAHTQAEALREVVRAFAVASARGAGTWGAEARSKALRSVADDTTMDVFDEVLKRVDQTAAGAKMLGELRRDAGYTDDALRAARLELEARRQAAQEELEKLRKEVAAVEWESTAAKARARRVERDERRAEIDTLTYPPPGPVPAVPERVVRVSGEAMRAEVERGRTDAARGRVTESPIAGVFLNDAARWAPYGAPIHMTRELLELFDLGPAEVPFVHAAPEDPPAETPAEGDQEKKS